MVLADYKEFCDGKVNDIATKTMNKSTKKENNENGRNFPE